MTSLRTIEGIDLQFIENNFSKKERKRIENVISVNVEKTHFFINNEKLF